MGTEVMAMDGFETVAALFPVKEALSLMLKYCEED